jgi:hypothetical protein
MQGRIPEVGEHVMVFGDLKQTRTVAGMVTRVSRQNCSHEKVFLTLDGGGEVLAEASQILIRPGNKTL